MKHPTRLVIVEDEKFVLMGLRSYFSSYTDEFKITGAFRNGADALQFCRANPPDILLTDIKMPQMDGLQLIGELRTLGVRSKIVVLSCHDEIDLVRKAFRLGAQTYVLKDEVEEEELIRILREIVSEESLVPAQGAVGAAEPLRLRDLVEEGGSETELSFTTIGVIAFKSEYDERLEPLPSLIDERALLQIVRDNLSTTEGAEAVYGLENDVCIVLRGESDADLRRKRDRTGEAVLGALEPVFNRTAFIGFSSLASTGRAFLDLYEDARGVVEHLFFFSDPKVLCRDILDSESRPVDDSRPDRMELSLSDGYEGWERRISAFFAFLKERPGCTPAEVKNEVDGAMQRLEGQLRSVYRRSLADFLSPSEPTVYERIEQIDDVGVLQQWLLRTLNRIWDWVQQNQDVDPLVGGVSAYLSEHYAEKLSLAVLGKRFNVHPNYLSSRFKEAKGVGVVEFVNSRRIEQAMVLLRATSASLKEISYQIGFDSPNYFSRTFKRIVGMSPTDFRAG